MPWTEGIMNTEEENSVGYGMATLDKEPVPVVYYNQKDPQYGKLPFGTDIIETHGCGPTAMAMVVSSLTDRPMDPGQRAQWAYENGYWKKGKGALHDLIPAAAQAWGLDVAGYQAKDAGQVLSLIHIYNWFSEAILCELRKYHSLRAGRTVFYPERDSIFFNEERRRRICLRPSLSPGPVPTGTDAGSVRPVAIGQVGCYLQRRNCGAHPSQNENHPPCICLLYTSRCV